MTTYLFETGLVHNMLCFNTLSVKTLPTPLLLHSYLFSCHEHCSDKFLCLEWYCFWVLFGYLCIWIICRKSQSFALRMVSQENVLWLVEDVGGCPLANMAYQLFLINDLETKCVCINAPLDTKLLFFTCEVSNNFSDDVWDVFFYIMEWLSGW